jgi:hypothetical protein
VRNNAADDFTVTADKSFYKFGVQLFNSSSILPIHEFNGGGTGAESTAKFYVRLTIQTEMNKEQKIDPTDQLEFYDNRKRHDVHLKKDHLKNNEISLADCYFICWRSRGEQKSSLRFPTVGNNYLKVSVCCGAKNAPVIKEETFKVVVKYPEVANVRTNLENFVSVRLGQKLPAFSITLSFDNSVTNGRRELDEEETSVPYYDTVMVTLSHNNSMWKNLSFAPQNTLGGSQGVACKVKNGTILCPENQWELQYNSRECGDIRPFPTSSSLGLKVLIEKVPQGPKSFHKNANVLFRSAEIPCGTIKFLPGVPATLLIESPTVSSPLVIRDDGSRTLGQEVKIECVDKWGHQTHLLTNEKWELRCEQNEGPLNLSVPNFNGVFHATQIDKNTIWIRNNMTFEQFDRIRYQTVKMSVNGNSKLSAKLPYKFDAALNVQGFRVSMFTFAPSHDGFLQFSYLHV